MKLDGTYNDEGQRGVLHLIQHWNTWKPQGEDTQSRKSEYDGTTRACDMNEANHRLTRSKPQTHCDNACIEFDASVV